MRNLHTTAEATLLCNTLRKVGIDAEMECSDGHKHVDICIHSAKLYIEVDGPAHFLNSKQIQRDFTRDGYSSKDGFDTFHVPNVYIEQNLFKLVGAIKRVVADRREILSGN